MENKLVFNPDNYLVKTVEMDGITLNYRAFEQIPYVAGPIDEQMQRLSIFVNEDYYQGKTINGYNLENAPIFLPNTVGGYMPGQIEEPGRNFMGETNASFYALLHGYVVVSPGVRGRGMKNAQGDYIGIAPAAICDLKAAVRYLKKNSDIIPGNADKIISNGTSAGGALSALLGSTGNHPDYLPYLEAMGAAKAEDNIFAASCYCPITNLEHADMAYEWEFFGLHDYHRMKIEETIEGKKKMTPVEGCLSEKQIRMSKELKDKFPEYLNQLNLTGPSGEKLILDKEGNGSFKEYILTYVKESAQRELDNGADLSALGWLTIKDGTVTDVDFDGYVTYRTRMKETPAFDAIETSTPENELFGTKDMQYRHFTGFSRDEDDSHTEMAEASQIKMMNPMNYLEDEKAVKAEHFRIRHGSIDRDTSLAISAMLTAKLENQGVDVNLQYPWGKRHAGDYDLEELFSWIDNLK